MREILTTDPPLTTGAGQTLTDRRRSPARLRGLLRAPLVSLIAWLEREALFVAGIAAVAAVILGKIPAHLNQDGWLALVDGRYVAQHGLPHRDTLAVLTHGVRWIDQQWLAQLVIYRLDQIGGLRLYGLVYVALTVGSFALAIVAARRLGGSAKHVVWALPLAAFLYFAGSFQIRTQGFAYPLFVATVWLLAGDGSTRSSRVLLVLPLLIVWANLHGSAILGAGIVALYGACRLAGELHEGRVSAQAGALLLGAPLCLLATPYGLSEISYYRDTLMNPAFKTLVVEWQPVSSFPVLAVPFFAAALATVWMLGHSRGRVRTFEALTLLTLIAGAISAERNITWFALAALILLPGILTAEIPDLRPSIRRPRLNLALVAASAAVLLMSLGGVVAHSSGWFESGYDAQALDRTAALAERDPRVRVYADGRFADWLLWHHPALAGRIAYDSRLELLSTRQLDGLAELTQIRTPGSHGLLDPYGLLVLETSRPSARLLLEQTGTATIIRGRDLAVATRSAR